MTLAMSLTTILGRNLVQVADFGQTTFTNILNHFDSQDDRTFSQRYWTNDEFFDKENGPVFLYICGEWTCSPPSDKTYPF